MTKLFDKPDTESHYKDVDEIFEIVVPYTKGKQVLDVGCVDHKLENKNKDREWAHGVLKQRAKHVVGIDILKDEIIILKEQGYDVHCINAEDFEFEQKFDVIFAGELIEHLSNAGLFLNCCKHNLKKNGYLILTTPNAFSIQRMVEMVVYGRNNPTVNDEHTTWYSPKVIEELLSRYGFKVESMHFVNTPHINPSRGVRAKEYLTKIIGKHFRETMIVIAKIPHNKLPTEQEKRDVWEMQFGP